MKINQKDLNKLIKNNTNLINNNNKTIKKVKRTYYDRLEDAIKTGFVFSNDEIIINKYSIIFKFNDVVFLSHNDILRIHFKRMYRYIKLWKERVKSICKDKDFSEWHEFQDKPMKIEFLYNTKNNEFLDYDSTIGAFKFILDGLTENKIIVDDSMNYVPIILSKQLKNKEKNSIYVVVSILDIEKYNDYFSDEFKNIY